MSASNGRILTTHTGSLPRPGSLSALLVEKAKSGEADQQRLTSAIDSAVKAIVQKQVELGIDIPNDGEQGRSTYFLHMRDRLSGLGGTWTRRRQADLDNYPDYLRIVQAEAAARSGISSLFGVPKAIGEVRYTDPKPLAAECGRLRSAVDSHKSNIVDAFITAPSPGILACAIRNEHYDSDAAYLRALGEALRVEYETIVNNGFLVQVDCPDLALERHMGYQDRPLSDFLTYVETAVEALNQSLANIPRDRIRLHVCWGNYEGPHDSDVPLADILPIISKAKAKAIVLPFANGRHAYEIGCFRGSTLRSDQVLVAGVIDTITNVIEHPETVAERIERAVAAVGEPAQVMAGTDCGFDTSAGNGRVAPAVAWAKLASLNEGAKIASQRVYGRRRQ